MSVLHWQRNGWLVHMSRPQEIRDLLAVVDRVLHDSEAKGLSADCRMNIAYNDHVGEGGYRRQPATPTQTRRSRL